MNPVRIALTAALAPGLLLALGLGPAATGAAPSDAGRSAAATRVVYHGPGVVVHRASGQVGRLGETPTAFRGFVRNRLDTIWRDWVGGDADCAQAPLVIVKEVRAKVAYISDEGSFPGGPGDAPDKCATGGNYHFFVKRDGRWRAPRALGGQDVMRCGAFKRWDVPRMNGAHQCWNGHRVVRWDG